MKIALTKPQARALIKGKGVQLKHSQLGDGKEVPLPADIMKRLERAHKKGMGARVRLADEYIHGSGFFDWVKENVLAPVGNIAKTVLGNVAAPLLTSVVQKKLGVGMKKKGGSFRVAGGSFKPAGRGAPRLSDNDSLAMAPQHPVMMFQPQLPPHDMSAVLRGRGLVVDPMKMNLKSDIVLPTYTRGAGARRRK